MTAAACLWCETEFELRATGGKTQKFCSATCRHGFHAACRDWAVAKVVAGRIPVSAVRAARNERARCLEHGLAVAGDQRAER